MVRKKQSEAERNTEGEYFKDEVDIFSTSRERIALNRGEDVEDSDSDASYDQPVLQLSRKDESDDDDDDDDESSEEEEKDAVEHGAWGNQRAHYYGGGEDEEDEDGVDPDDLAGSKLEEQEAMRLQKQRLASIGEAADFEGGLFDDDDEDDEDDEDEDDEDAEESTLGRRTMSAREAKRAAKAKKLKKKKKKKSKASGGVMVLASRSLAERRRGMTAEEKLDRMASESPELLALIEELSIRSRELSGMPQRITTLRGLAGGSEEWATQCQRGLGLLRLKQRVLASYCMNIIAFLHLHAALTAEAAAPANAVFLNKSAASAAQRAEADASALFASDGLFDGDGLFDDAGAAAADDGGVATKSAVGEISIGERRMALRRHGSLAAIEEHIAIIKVLMPLETKLKKEMRAWKRAGAVLNGEEEEASSSGEECRSLGEEGSSDDEDESEEDVSEEVESSDAEAAREAAEMRRKSKLRREEEAAFMGGDFEEDEDEDEEEETKVSIAGRLRQLSKLDRTRNNDEDGGEEEATSARSRRKLSRYAAPIDPSVLHMVNALEQKAQTRRMRNGLGEVGGGDDTVVDEAEKVRRREAILAREAARYGYAGPAGETMEGYGNGVGDDAIGYSSEYLGMEDRSSTGGGRMEEGTGERDEMMMMEDGEYDNEAEAGAEAEPEDEEADAAADAYVFMFTSALPPCLRAWCECCASSSCDV